LQGTDEFQPGTIAHMAEPAEGVRAKGPLHDFAFWRTVEEGAPAFQLEHPVGASLAKISAIFQLLINWPPRIVSAK
jgi:hypothetical protein